MDTSGKDLYFVAVKLFLRHGDNLLIMKDNFGDWDLPGGRIKPNEFETALHDVLQRKIKEELGNEVVINFSKMPVVFLRHERVEKTVGNPTVRIFALGYEGELKSGRILTSDRHVEIKWVDIVDFEPQHYFTGGWLKGVQEYLFEFRNKH